MNVPEKYKHKRKIYISFRLTMPGYWSDKSNFVIVRNFSIKNEFEKAMEILNCKSFVYSFDDGWHASIHVEELEDYNEAKKVEKNSGGFCDYEWMVESIIENMEIKL